MQGEVTEVLGCIYRTVARNWGGYYRSVFEVTCVCTDLITLRYSDIDVQINYLSNPSFGDIMCMNATWVRRIGSVTAGQFA